jgi:hypothetical protein
MALKTLFYKTYHSLIEKEKMTNKNSGNETIKLKKDVHKKSN